MTPTKFLEHCGFVRQEGAGSEIRMRFARARNATIDVETRPWNGRAAYHASVEGIMGERVLFRTEDVRDVTALAAALLNAEAGPGPFDPATVMRTPGGDVPNPFSIEGEPWLVRRGADGAFHLDNPEARWGAVYREFRDGLAARFEGTPPAAPPLEYLRAAGFAPGARGLEIVLRPMEGFVNEPPDVLGETVTITVVDGHHGGMPDGESTHFEVRRTDGEPGILDVVYRADDARDVLAFVDACHNDVVGRHGYSGPEERIFGHERSGMAIHNAFAGHYGDWDVTNKRVGEILVADPWINWGHEYVAWRDGRAGAILAAAPAAASPEIRP